MRSVSMVTLVMLSSLAWWCFLTASVAESKNISRRLPRWKIVSSYLPPSSSLSSWSLSPKSAAASPSSSSGRNNLGTATAAPATTTTTTAAIDTCADTATQVRGGGVSSKNPLPPGAAGGGRVSFDVDSVRAVFRSLVSTGETLWKTKILPIARDPETYLVQPIQDFLYNQTQAAQERRQEVYHKTTSCGTLSALAFFFRPVRLMKLCLISWLCGEALAATGIFFGDDTNNGRLEQVTEQIKSAWLRIRDWWTDNLAAGNRRNPIDALRNVETWEPKHQWALGAGIGLALSPLFIPLGRVAAKAAIVAYVLGEINHRSRATIILSPSSKFFNADESGSSCQEWIKRLEAALERWRQIVHAAMEDPGQVIESIRDSLLASEYVLGDDNDEVSEFFAQHVTPTLKRGLISGVVAGLVVGV